MADDEDEGTRPSPDQEPLPESAREAEPTGTETPKPKSRARLLVLIGVLVVVALIGTWMIAGARAATEFDDSLDGEQHSMCDGELGIDDVRPEMTAPNDLPDGLDEVAAAFEAYFGQERFAFTDVSEDEDGPSDIEIRYAVDGNVLERRTSEGFVGLIEPRAGVAQFEGDRFWVPACVSGFPTILPFDGPTCVEHTTKGDTTTVRWLNRDEGTCEGDQLWFEATLVDGDLTSWGVEAVGRQEFHTTWTVTDPVALSWPSPFWTVPGFLAGNDN